MIRTPVAVRLSPNAIGGNLPDAKRAEEQDEDRRVSRHAERRGAPKFGKLCGQSISR